MPEPGSPLHVVHVHLGLGPRDAREHLSRLPTLTRLCEEQARRGARVTVVGRHHADGTIEEAGVTYRLVRDHPSRALPGPLTRDVAVYRTVRDLAPDVVHFNGLLFPLQLAELRTWIGRHPLLAAQHHDERPGRAPKAVLQRLCLPRADVFLFTAEALAAEWRHAGIPPGAAVRELLEGSTDFRPIPRDEARAATNLTGRPAVLWAKRLTAAKDPLTALEGFARAIPLLPGAVLTMLFGEADLLPAIEARLRADPGLAARVRLVGRVEREAMPLWLSGADLFLTSSLRESANYALVEAMACGTRPVASDIPPHRAIVGSLGSLFPPGDAVSLASALVAAASLPPARGAVRERFESELSWPAIGRRSLAIYRELLAGGTHG